jgi:Saf4/Yju2 protein
MGERKVLNKYIPADFDPSLVPRGKKLSSKDGTVPVRMMLPFTIQCASCNTFLYRGRKYNAKKENMDGPEGRYLGIQRYRFYFKCNHCSRTLTLLTDPKNTDYEMELGGTRNYDVHKDKKNTEDEFDAQKEQEEKEDPMRALENRVLDSQREMADMDNMEEILAMNRKHLQFLSSPEEIFAALDARKRSAANLDSIIELEEEAADGLTAEDEELIQSIQFGKQKNVRLSESDEEREEQRRRMNMEESRQRQQKRAEKQVKTIVPKIKVKRKKIVTKQEAKGESTKAKATAPGNSLGSLLAGYESSSASE